MPPLSLTVIICTYNRAHIIGECLESLCAQTVPVSKFAVLVADNNSTDDTPAVLERFISKLPHLKILHESRQGAGYARNHALTETRTGWVACLDSDAKAHSNWLERMLEVINSNDFDCFGGPFLPWHPFGPPPAWFAPDWESTANVLNEYGPLRPGLYPTGGNCAMRRDLALSLGGFPTEIGMTGNKCAYGEETLLFHTMRQAGARLGCVPDMLIDHCVLPYKYSLRWRLRSAWAHGRDDAYICETPPTGRTVYLAARSLAGEILRIPKRLPACLRRGFLPQRIVLECLTPVLTQAGTLLTRVRQLRSQRKAARRKC